MGHSEMLLAVAGLSPDDIQDRTRQLAGTDWSGFPAPERVAFQFGRKLTSEPWAVTREDVHALTDAFGSERALDLIWWVAWGNYMTRVADAFALPLETTNVFEKRRKP